MPPVNVLIKPASSSCNLRCGYCFYHDEEENRSKKSYGIMSEETLESIIRKALEYASGSCTFGFQGGEPLLAGLDFFKAAVELQKKHNTKKLAVHNALQTNGTLIDDEWAAFFAENKFLIGVSIDGFQDLHDLYRYDAKGDGTFKAVMRGIDALKRYKAEFNVLTVVTAQTAKNIKKAYSFFMKNGLVYQQYIPCLDPIGQKKGTERYSLTPELYARFLKDLFDVWYADRAEGKFVYNRYFENLAGILLGYNPESCDMYGICQAQYAIEADGSVYPCDFYMLDGFCIGNINRDSMEAINQNRIKSGFIQRSAYVPEQCKSCKWMPVCRNGCQRYRLGADSPDAGLNYYCKAYKEFFTYAMERLIELVRPRSAVSRF